MSYQYRKMTPSEQADVVALRLRRGYPPHAPPHPFRQHGSYLLTAANYEHVPVMKSPDRRDEFQTRLHKGFRSIDVAVSGWVILPNHYHVLVMTDSLDRVSSFLKLLHGTTAREWNMADEMTGKRRVWYKFSDRWLREERHCLQALNYIHYNPLKHGYVNHPYLWVWSSLHWYHETKGRRWLRDNWKAYPAADFGKGWDD